jgi:hypothetical protein
MGFCPIQFDSFLPALFWVNVHIVSYIPALAAYKPNPATEGFATEMQVLIVLTFYIITKYCYFVMSSVEQIASCFGIYCFTLDRRPTADGKKTN